MCNSIRGVVVYSLSPYEQKAFANAFAKGVPNMVRRFKGQVFRVVPRKSVELERERFIWHIPFYLTALNDLLPSSWQLYLTYSLLPDTHIWHTPFYLTSMSDILPSTWHPCLTYSLLPDSCSWHTPFYLTSVADILPSTWQLFFSAEWFIICQLVCLCGDLSLAVLANGYGCTAKQNERSGFHRADIIAESIMRERLGCNEVMR